MDSMIEYQEAAMRTLSGYSKKDPLGTAALGLAGEAGEVADHMKKVFYHGHQLDRKKLMKEAGDILWYIACLCEGLDVSMSEIASLNIEKLRKRYPEGFDTNRSINKDESKE